MAEESRSILPPTGEELLEMQEREIGKKALERQREKEFEKGREMLLNVYGFTEEELTALEKVVPGKIGDLIERGEQVIRREGAERAGLLVRISALKERLSSFDTMTTGAHIVSASKDISYGDMFERGLAEKGKTFVDLVREAKSRAT